MRALRFLLPLAAALLPAPALADVTARYGIGSSMLTIEADDGGDWRFQVSGKTPILILRHDGIDYVVLTDSTDKVSVTRLDAVLAVFFGKVPPPPEGQAFKLEAGPTDRVAGYSGTAWRFGPEGEPPIELLMSADPVLTPIGDVFRHLAGMGVDGLVPLLKADANVADLIRALFAKGTPLRLRPPETDRDRFLIELASVSTAEIDPARFVLPGPEISAEQFFDALRKGNESNPPPTITVN
ncbi:hypothetical protein OF829_07760 [Sphingomonas sp. LB-2]|uniref:hypothetical protein n=1 Tax=Sphingomonas caeni TaxID=2984949 RepID=UPI00222EA499|nr:hypothetical protein [Sphingomonas caeni]MCW3847132.1 hypothetical protein [Sphingomonas caeni]